MRTSRIRSTRRALLRSLAASAVAVPIAGLVGACSQSTTAPSLPAGSSGSSGGTPSSSGPSAAPAVALTVIPTSAPAQLAGIALFGSTLNVWGPKSAAPNGDSALARALADWGPTVGGKVAYTTFDATSVAQKISTASA